MVNAHRRRNFLQSIIINGRSLEKEGEINDGLINAFQNLLSTSGVGAHLFLGFLSMRSGMRKLLSWRKLSLRRRFGVLSQVSMETRLLALMASA